ncbi:MAG: DUF2877 domain-containing protein [Caldilineales bacterium]
MSIQSISLRIAPVLHHPQFTAQVESAFADACNLLTPDGVMLALVSHTIGNGPLNAVLSHFSEPTRLSAGDWLRGNGQTLWLPRGQQLSLTQAALWQPIPAYHHLAAQPETVTANIAWLRGYLPLHAPPASFAAIASASASGAFGNSHSLALGQMQAERLAAGLLHAYAAADLPALHGYAGQLAGLGPGLTPAGDDWLAGWLMGLHTRAGLMSATAHPLSTADAAAAVLSAAQGRTTRLSLAFLQAAADGAANEAWHNLITTLSKPSKRLLRAATAQVMAHGATSGSDMLAGFLAAFNNHSP